MPVSPFAPPDRCTTSSTRSTIPPICAGSTAGKDAAQNKPTYVSLLGVARARDLAQELRRDAHKALADFGARAARLGDLADFIVTRQF